MAKQDYILTSTELSEDYNFDIKQYLLDANNAELIIEESYQLLITKILDNNDTMANENDIFTFLGSDEFKIKALKKAQSKIIKNLFYLGADENPTKDIMPILSGELRIVSINGFQKRIFKRND